MCQEAYGNGFTAFIGFAAAKDWLAARQAELLPVEYYHVVFTLPGPIGDIA